MDVFSSSIRNALRDAVDAVFCISSHLWMSLANSSMTSSPIVCAPLPAHSLRWQPST